MKWVCHSCFNDDELIGFIESEGIEHYCDYCLQEQDYTIQLDELKDFFYELLSEFEIDNNGIPLLELIQKNWNFFTRERCGENIINEILTEFNLRIPHAQSKVNFSIDIRYNVEYWFELKEQLKWNSRYITDIDYITSDLNWDSYLSTVTEVDSEKDFFRARIHQNHTQTCYAANEMTAPQREISSAGRANPRGIPFLYLSEDMITTVYEVRASYLDLVTIATFNIKKNEKNHTLADFTETSSLFYPTKVKERIKSSVLKNYISDDLSKPMRRYDSELDYIPTQFICEFIKKYVGVAGIKFKSSFHSQGNNVVIFDQNIMKCTNTELVRVNELNIEINKLE